ncbi:hypothetical protein CWO89_00985 [Bradyrhizobium sp. Leo170]|nr:hypothetical protein CWO89_00985 [Bradyrhizobium sp. Leo170]
MTTCLAVSDVTGPGIADAISQSQKIWPLLKTEQGDASSVRGVTINGQADGAAGQVGAGWRPI